MADFDSLVTRVVNDEFKRYETDLAKAFEASEKLEEEYRQVLIEVSSLKAEMESLSSKLRELEPFREVKVPPAQLKIFKIMIGYAARSAIPKIREIEGVALVEGESATERVPVLLIARKEGESYDQEDRGRDLPI